MNHNAVWFCGFTIQEQQDVSRSVRWCTLRTLSGKMNFNVIIFQCGWYRGIIVYLALKEQRCSFRAFFDVIGNFVSITSKTLREDRTAADKKHVAYCDPPQAENLAGEILL